ncbi:cytochrome P450 302a1, mitochondrial-like isoform X2 [Penaeus chinensis]|nr:cytochrome P450 302a1, mitochondrial-like isoform X2 [Penaeus chinensis]XP_047494189.1 cytochrome P450 302a1, mitochondrial-like isoform X2 [Penaeus chinensis]
MALFRSLVFRTVPQSHSAVALSHGTFRPTSARCLSSAKEIPGPKALPIAGVLFSMLSDKDFDKNNIHVYFKKLFKTYGPIVKLQFPGKPTLVILNDPEDMKWVHHCTRDSPVRSGFDSLKKARYLDDYYEKGGITIENGEEWWRVRKRVQIPIMRFSNIRQYVADMDGVAFDILDRISKERNEEGELTSDLKDLMNRLALESVCLISLNRRLGSLDPNLPHDSEQMKFYRAALDLLRCIFECDENPMWKIYPNKAFKTLRESLNILTEVCDKTLWEYKEGLKERNERDPDCSHRMIEQLLLDQELSHKDIVTFMMDLIPGGTETTASASIVLLYLLAKYPEVQAKAQEEVDHVLGKDRTPITAKQVNQLSYIRATLKESFRLLPPALGTSRLLQKDIKVRGYTLHKGWDCLMTSAVSALDESQFAQPQDFVPDRWLQHRPLGQIHPYASLPFSHGKRKCIGIRIAEQIMSIFIARVLQRYNLAWRGEDLHRTHIQVFQPVAPFSLSFTDRN